MEPLLEAIKELQQSETGTTIKQRMKEFKELGNKSMDRIFNELCFCITTANCSAERCIAVQKKMGNGFLTLSETQLALKLKEFKYRFPNIRAKYIVQARKLQEELKNNIETCKDLHKLREWVVTNIKGLGYKEASHFLRNIGFKDYAIIDFHILDLLMKFNIIEKPKALTKTKYLEIEELLDTIAKKLNLNLSELDLYMWYMETGKILK
ncbi:MAG: N-glycosylase/DNA lyase [Candidatus Thorarchaeota archaeon]